MNETRGERLRECASLFADLYELTMLGAYGACGMDATATFSLFVRELPAGRNFLLACGLDLESFRFSADEIAYLRSLNMLPESLFAALADFRFAGDVFAAPEGAPVFTGEPILEVTAPIGQAQAVETLVVNQISLQTVLASKAARVVEAAAGRPVVDFGARRAQGLDAAIKGARAFAIAGVSATSLLAAGARYNIPVTGTMAHSFVQAFDDELEAFAAFAEIYPSTVLLVDTYDTLEGVRRAIKLARRLGDDCRLTGVRLDSGDLDALSRAARGMLNEAGLGRLKIVASGGLNEARVEALVKAGAPIDVFGVGTEMSVSADAPALDIAYKLTEYAGHGRMKLSARKGTMPGRKQIFRRTADGVAVGDVVARRDETLEGTPLLEPAMLGGTRVKASAPLSELRERSGAMIAALPPALRGLEQATEPYPVAVSDRLQADANALALHLSHAAGP
ncbi:MAG TPA: nicotinate phosphoribosyltransferase [Roseiarcus sp.]|nr:nicotinate phosphoribosyltransferase [Roseiarcus sp.]